MSQYKMSFIEYFKIRWARHSTWSLKEAAYLSFGFNPDEGGYDISPEAENTVSKRWVWLSNKYKKGHLHVIGHRDDGVELFDLSAIARLLREKDIPFDDNMLAALDHLHNAHLKIDCTEGLVTRTVFREAGSIIFEFHPKAIIINVAQKIENLPQYFNERGVGYINKLSVTTIASYLKNLSDLKQKPKMGESPSVEIDIKQLAEKL